MPTLVTRATRAPAPARPVGRSESRGDERVRLGRPHLGGSELVRAFVEDTSGLAHALEATDTLLGVLHRFQAGLAAEAELYAERELDAAMRHQTIDIARLAL